eukprot:7673332-Alexandrium_andersonii.AAC.1
MFANEEAPEFHSIADARKLGLRRDELVAHGALDGAIENPAEFGSHRNPGRGAPQTGALALGWAQ